MISNQTIRQFLSYFGVGGVSAIVEWAVFSLFEALFNVPFLLATALAFLVSTSVNWYLGRRFTFKSNRYQNKRGKEIVLVFSVSAVGLILNLILMAVFVNVFRMNTHLLKTVAKILATGIVFFWNYLSRKYWIYANM